MGLLDGLEKLINEHGSAAILRERIALANEKYAALQSENSVLKSTNAALKLDNAKLEKQVQDYEHRLKEFSDSRHAVRRPKDEEEILVLLAKSGLSEEDVIKAIGKTVESTRFDLVELANAGLIEHKNLYGLLTHCGLTQEGRRYLKTYGLLG